MVTFRLAHADDIARLLPLMQDFYAFERLPWDEARTRRILADLVAEPRLGQLILFEDNGALAGYMVLTFGYSVEFGGRNALIDEFYVMPERRCAGIGKLAIENARRICLDAGVKAIHLEADHFNTRAHEFYKRLGFRDHERHLMTWWIQENKMTEFQNWSTGNIRKLESLPARRRLCSPAIRD